MSKKRPPGLPGFLQSLTPQALALSVPAATLRTLGHHASDYPEGDALTPVRRRELEQAHQVSKALLPRVAGSDAALLVHVMILGKLGHVEEALAQADSLHRDHRTWTTAVTLANAHRRGGQLEDALRYFCEAATLDGTDVTALLEIGDLLLGNQQWEEAIEAYQEALNRERGQAWARPSVYFCKFQRDGDRIWLRRLRALARAQPDPCDAVMKVLGERYVSSQRIARAQSLLARLPGESDRLGLP